MVDYKEYKAAYEQLLSSEDDVDRDTLMSKMNTFLEKYPTIIPADENPKSLVTELSLGRLFKNMIQVIIDVIEDVSKLVSNSSYTDSATTRRGVIEAITRPGRRLYVGIFIVLLSFILYFIDSTA